jgi:peptidoglycan-associated lipoprotein
MKTKLLAAVSALFMLAACAGLTPKDGSSDAVDSAADAYDLRSRGLSTFEAIPGDSTGARAGDRVFFAYDSSLLSARAQSTLDKQISWLKSNSSVNVSVEGHADERGTREYNIALGARRANAAKNYLVAAGVASNRISTVSYGKERPAVVGSTEEAYAQNRRAVTVLLNQ